MSKGQSTQADMIRLELERDIFDGHLKPGSSVEEGRLAERFGVSRTPVREAIANLVQAGLLTKSAHRRAVVRKLDAGSLLELFEALSEMEGAAGQLAAARMTEDDRTALLQIHDEAAEILRQNGDPNRYADLGQQFHSAIVKACRNSVLIQTIEWLSMRVLPYRRYQVVAPGRLEKNQNDHDRIVAALLKGDGETTRIEMRRHTAEQGDALMRFIALHKLSYADLVNDSGGDRAIKESA